MARTADYGGEGDGYGKYRLQRWEEDLRVELARDEPPELLPRLMRVTRHVAWVNTKDRGSVGSRASRMTAEHWMQNRRAFLERVVRWYTTSTTRAQALLAVLVLMEHADTYAQMTALSTLWGKLVPLGVDFPTG